MADVNEILIHTAGRFH